jgi:hypothetical protein
MPVTFLIDLLDELIDSHEHDLLFCGLDGNQPLSRRCPRRGAFVDDLWLNVGTAGRHRAL